MGRIKKPIVWLMIVAMFVSGGWLNFATPIVKAESDRYDDWLKGILSTVQAGGSSVTMASSSDVVYVKASAKPGGDGSSWETAFDDLQEALEDADEQLVTGAESIEIWVAAGTYVPTNPIFPDRVQRSIAFEMRNNVAIYGGFPADASDLDGMETRDWETHRTILSGDVEGNDQPHHPNFDHTWRVGADRSDNTPNIIFNQDNAGLNRSAILDGFIISGANNTQAAIYGFGGGIRNGASNSITLRNLIIEDNVNNNGGTGLFNGENSDTLLTNVTVQNNLAHFGNVNSTYGLHGGVGISNTGKLTIIQ